MFERLPQLRSNASNPDDTTCLIPLLPDRWLAEHPESELPMRTREMEIKAARRHTRRTSRRRALAQANRRRR